MGVNTATTDNSAHTAVSSISVHFLGLPQTVHVKPLSSPPFAYHPLYGQFHVLEVFKSALWSERIRLFDPAALRYAVQRPVCQSRRLIGFNETSLTVLSSIQLNYPDCVAQFSCRLADFRSKPIRRRWLQPNRATAGFLPAPD